MTPTMMWVLVAISILFVFGAWCIRKNTKLNNYIDDVKEVLELNDCPFWEIDICMVSYFDKHPPYVAADRIMNFYEERKVDERRSRARLLNDD